MQKPFAWAFALSACAACVARAGPERASSASPEAVVVPPGGTDAPISAEVERFSSKDVERLSGYAPREPAALTRKTDTTVYRGEVLDVVMTGAARALGRRMKACLGDVRGSLTLDVVVNANGTVGSVEASQSTLPDAETKCILQLWTRTTFPPPLHDAAARALIPLVFR